jgi:hypothetical protein
MPVSYKIVLSHAKMAVRMFAYFVTSEWRMHEIIAKCVSITCFNKEPLVLVPDNFYMCEITETLYVITLS